MSEPLSVEALEKAREVFVQVMDDNLKPENAKHGDFVHAKHLIADEDNQTAMNVHTVHAHNGEFKRVDRDWFKFYERKSVKQK